MKNDFLLSHALLLHRRCRRPLEERLFCVFVSVERRRGRNEAFFSLGVSNRLVVVVELWTRWSYTMYVCTEGEKKVEKEALP